jgi:hypothetical protein
VVESLKNLDLEELEKDNKAVEVGEKIEYNATSSPVISSQIENDQHRSVSPISVVVDDSSNHATNFNADETLNLEDDSEVYLKFNQYNFIIYYSVFTRLDIYYENFRLD